MSKLKADVCFKSLRILDITEGLVIPEDNQYELLLQKKYELKKRRPQTSLFY